MFQKEKLKGKNKLQLLAAMHSEKETGVNAQVCHVTLNWPNQPQAPITYSGTSELMPTAASASSTCRTTLLAI